MSPRGRTRSFYPSKKHNYIKSFLFSSFLGLRNTNAENLPPLFIKTPYFGNAWEGIELILKSLYLGR